MIVIDVRSDSCEQRRTSAFCRQRGKGDLYTCGIVPRNFRMRASPQLAHPPLCHCGWSCRYLGISRVMGKCTAQRVCKIVRSLISHLTLVFTLVHIVYHLHDLHGHNCFRLLPLSSCCCEFRTPCTYRVVFKCTLECGDEGRGAGVISYARFFLSSDPVVARAR